MITRSLVLLGRHRRVILVAALALSAGYLLAHLRVPSLGQRTFPAMVAAVAVFLILALVAVSWRRPTAFEVHPRVPAFSAPSSPVFLFAALAFLTVATGMAGNVVRDWGSEPFLPDQVPALGWAAVALLQIVNAWRDTGVQLRPEGLWQRGITGWLVVPWEAAPGVSTLPPSPRADTVRLEYGRPELVRRHGIPVHRDRLRAQDVDARLLAAAVRYYGAHPEGRPAIGTPAEYDRLMLQILSSPAAAVADRWR